MSTMNQQRFGGFTRQKRHRIQTRLVTLEERLFGIYSDRIFLGNTSDDFRAKRCLKTRSIHGYAWIMHEKYLQLRLEIG